MFNFSFDKRAFSGREEKMSVVNLLKVHDLIGFVPG